MIFVTTRQLKIKKELFKATILLKNNPPSQTLPTMRSQNPFVPWVP